MSDAIYSPTDGAPAPEPTIELPVYDGREVDEATFGKPDKSGLTPREAAAELRRRRQEETPTPENASRRPIFEHKVQHDRPLTLKQAAEDVSFAHGNAFREKMLAEGYS